jgi:hypothetical protein
MRITLDANEIIVPSGQYGDKDDGLCRGCGAEHSVWSEHTIVDCLRTLREAIIELQKNPLVKGKVKLYGREDIENDVEKPKTINKPTNKKGKGKGK